jgi:hypothetical protein
VGQEVIIEEFEELAKPAAAVPQTPIVQQKMPRRDLPPQSVSTPPRRVVEPVAIAVTPTSSPAKTDTAARHVALSSKGPEHPLEKAIKTVCGRALEKVTVTPTSAHALRIAMKVGPCSKDEANRLGLRVMGMAELNPYEVDLQLTVTTP